MTPDASPFSSAWAHQYLARYGERDSLREVVSSLRYLGGATYLDVGAGVGRVAIPLASTGVEVMAIDLSPAMIAQLRANADGLCGLQSDVADATNFALQSMYDVAYATFNTFFQVGDNIAKSACVACVSNQLNPGGFLLLETFVPRPPAHSGTVDEGTPRQPGATRRVWDLENQTLHVERWFDSELLPEGVTSRRWVFNYLSAEDQDELLSSSGFERVHDWGAWTRKTRTDADVNRISVYRRNA